MKTVRRLLYRNAIGSVLLVAGAFLALFFIVDVVDELSSLGRANYIVGWAMASVAWKLPGHFYELLPIAVLIGTIYTMARLAQSSEFTVLRTSGLGPTRALVLLATLGIGFGAVTFAIGELLVPVGESQAALLKSRAVGGRALGRTGAWLKEHREGDEGPRNYSVNVLGTDGRGGLRGIRIYEHDDQGRLRSRTEAATGRVVAHGGQSEWQLDDVQRTLWPADDKGSRIDVQRQPNWSWTSTLNIGLVSAAVSPIQTMSTLGLWRYSRHLSTQEQAAQRYELQFWKRALYPLACLVMVALALPFGYLHARGGGISLKVFGGIMLGISFVLLNNFAGHLVTLRDWTPWFAAALPSLVYLALSLAAFGWLVRYR